METCRSETDLPGDGYPAVVANVIVCKTCREKGKKKIVNSKKEGTCGENRRSVKKIVAAFCLKTASEKWGVKGTR